MIRLKHILPKFNFNVFCQNSTVHTDTLLLVQLFDSLSYIHFTVGAVGDKMGTPKLVEVFNAKFSPINFAVQMMQFQLNRTAAACSDQTGLVFGFTFHSLRCGKSCF